ncbi:hypothetical protein [Rhizobium sp. BK176]|uniref:hypothetical protein n=1 Tax=Rhizobium sp. BK176 TaxID=2587071 RepID=UPI002166E9E2|nr:hypothetical protein [Rhizobium sp. BK176]MCS4088469.1 hypothetical protein [Rhizobium sp. BK176]
MTALDFTFGAPKQHKDPEAQMFASCLNMARMGETSSFPLRVAESISISVDGKNGKGPQLATFALTFESFIPVHPEGDALTIQYETFEGTDASSHKSHSVRVWANECAYLEVGKQRPSDMSLPEYLRRTARDWATARIENEIANLRSPNNASAWEIEHAVDIKEISYLICEEFNQLSIAVDSIGDPTLGRMGALPTLRLGPDPIMGATHHLTLAFADPRGKTWQDSLLSFPIADHASADAIRSKLVLRHCNEHDPDFGYDWTDSRLVGTDSYKDRDESLMAISQRFDVAGVLRDIGESFSVVFSNTGGEWKHIYIALRDKDLDGQLQAIRDIAEIRPKEYADFLAASGWTLPFDPLELYELRLRQHRGLSLNDEPSPQTTTFGPKP